MRVKQILAFFAAVAICVPAAVYRFKDSGHAMGRLSANGGHVRQALKLDPGKRWYVVTVGGTVSRSYRGDARVAVEGRPEMEYEIHRSGPVLDLGMRRAPVLRDNVLVGLEPRDRFTVSVVMWPRNADWKCEQASAFENTVTFRDTETDETVLEIPVVYQPEKEAGNDEQM